MKLLKKILLGTAALAAFSTTAAYASDQSMAEAQDHVVLVFNAHGSYNLITRVQDPTMTVGLSVCNRGSCSANCNANGANDGGNSVVAFRDNAHGQQVPR